MRFNIWGLILPLILIILIGLLVLGISEIITIYLV